MDKFNVHSYVEEKYSSILKDYEQDYGNNGLDLLWSCTNAEEVDDLLKVYVAD